MWTRKSELIETKSNKSKYHRYYIYTYSKISGKCRKDNKQTNKQFDTIHNLARTRNLGSINLVCECVEFFLRLLSPLLRCWCWDMSGVLSGFIPSLIAAARNTGWCFNMCAMRSGWESWSGAATLKSGSRAYPTVATRIKMDLMKVVESEKRPERGEKRTKRSLVFFLGKCEHSTCQEKMTG